MKKKFKLGKDCIGVGGGILIFNKKGEIFLAKRGKNVTNQSGWWSKPGGGIEFGEKAKDAVEREIFEEHGIKIKIWGLLPHTDYIIKNEGQHWLSVNYLADIKSGEPKIMEIDKCDEIGWFNLNKLPKKMVQNTKESIKNYLDKKYIKL